MADRRELIREAYAALDGGDLRPFTALFEPGARWVGIPGSGCQGETPT